MGDGMELDFKITSIDNVIFVSREDYPEKSTSFHGDLKSQELIFNYSGRSTVYFNEKVLHVTEKTLRYLPKGNVDRYIVDRETRGECVDVFFQTDKPLSLEAFVLHTEEKRRLDRLFDKIFSVWVRKDSGYYFECMALLYQIFAQLQKQNYIPEKQYQAIQPAIQYIESNFLKEAISMERLTALCGISYSYLKKIFIRKFGVPPKKYILQLKIHYACDLLRSGLYSVTQISDMCGFSSIYYFSRQFKEYIGLSPTEYIRKHRPGNL